jgi:autotransporter-associated beta strand protein
LPAPWARGSAAGALINNSTAASSSGQVTLNDGTNNYIGGSGQITLSSGLGASANPLTMVGSGTLILGASSGRSGPTTVQSGTIQLNNAGGLGSAAITISSGATLKDNDGLTALANAITLNNNGTLWGSANGSSVTGVISIPTSGPPSVTLKGGSSASDVFTVSSGASNRLTGGMTGAKINIEGPGTVDIGDGASIRTIDVIGDWYLNTGKLKVLADGELGNTANKVYFQGGALLTGAAFTVSSARTLDFSNASGGTIDTTGGNLTLATASQLVGTSAQGTLTKAGANSLLITAANKGFNAPVTVNAGTLNLQNAAALGSTTKSVITLNTGATLYLRFNGACVYNNNVVMGGNATIKVARVSGNGADLLKTLGSLTMSGQILTVDVGANTGDLAFSGVMLSLVPPPEGGTFACQMRLMFVVHRRSCVGFGWVCGQVDSPSEGNGE